MISPIESFEQAGRALSRFLMTSGASLPESTLEHLLTYASHPSPVDKVVNSAEALFAIKGQLSKEGRELTAQLAQFAAVNGFHGMGERGQRIAQAMNRMGNYAAPDGTSWPAAEDDPEPLDRFVEEDEVVETGEPAPSDNASAE